MVDIVHLGFLVDEFNQIFDDRGDVLLGQHADIVGDIKVELGIDSVATHIAQIVAFFGEEELLDDAAGSLLVWRFGVAKLTVDVLTGFLGVVSCIFLEGVVDDGVVDAVLVLVFDEDGFHIQVEDFLNVFLGEFDIALDDHLGTLHGDDLAGVLVDEILGPGLHHTSGELFAENFLQIILVDLHLFGELKDIEDILVGLVADGAEQRGDGQFLLTVDIRIHDVVDIGRKLHPRTFERNDTCGVELSAVGVELGAEEDARGAVQLGNDDTLGTVDDEGALRSHVGNHAEIDMLLERLEVLVFGVFATQFHLGFQRHAVGEAALDALLDGIAGRIDVIIQEFEFKIVSRIRNGEVFFKDLVQAFVQTVVGVGFNLEEILERLDLDVEEIRVLKLSYRREIYYCGFFFCQGTKKLYRVL